MTDRVLLTARQAVKLVTLAGLGLLALEVRSVWRWYH